jgi:hypothetical protein
MSCRIAQTSFRTIATSKFLTSQRQVPLEVSMMSPIQMLVPPSQAHEQENLNAIRKQDFSASESPEKMRTLAQSVRDDLIVN